MSEIPPNRPPAARPIAVQRPTAPRPAPTTNRFSVTGGITRKAWKLGIYGAAAAGKSSLESLYPGIVVADLENSTRDLNVLRVGGIAEMKPDGSLDEAKSWSNLRAWVQSVTPATAPAIGIDSMTRAEDWCAQFVIANKKANDGAKATDSLEDFKYKAGLTFILDEYRRFISDLENANMRGVNIVMVAHARTRFFKNAEGADFARIEPRLIHTEDKGSNVSQFVEFLDHLAYIELDTAVTKGKASGGGSRTIYLDNKPSRIAKTRYLSDDPLPWAIGDGKLWEMLGVVK